MYNSKIAYIICHKLNDHFCVYHTKSDKMGVAML